MNTPKANISGLLIAALKALLRGNASCIGAPGFQWRASLALNHCIEHAAGKLFPMSLPLSVPARFVPLDDEWKRRFAPASVGLFEWTDYFFHFPGAQSILVNEKVVAPLAPGVFRVRWENALGLASITPQRGGVPCEAPLWVEVLSPKFPTPDAHFALLSRLLGDLFAWSRHLIWTNSLAETRRGADSEERALSPLEALDWAREFGARFERLVAHFLDSPPRRFEAETREVAPSQVSTLDGAILNALAADSSRWQPNSRGIANLGAAPERVPQTRRLETFDGENLRVLAQLAREIRGALQDAKSSAWWVALPEQICEVAERIRKAAHALLKRFGGLPAPRGVNLERGAANRELETLRQSWRGAGAPFWGEVERFARVRDVALLWEFWAFPALTLRLGAIWNEEPRFEAEFDAARGLLRPSKAVFTRGELVWNSSAPSYSTPLRPDFLWMDDNALPRVAFDAKFRLDTETGSGLGADLHKMHAYRDALGVGAALTLHPGSKTQFFDRERGPLERLPLRAILEGVATGVGSWALNPSLSEHPNSDA